MTADELDELLHAKTPAATKIWESIARGAQLYSTPLFSLKLTSDGDQLDLAGSGTYIREGERYFILTAAHVWHKVLKDSDFVGVTLREVDDHRCFIETKAIVPRGPARPEAWNNLGPDIVSLEIPPSRVGEIKALKGFYEMDGGLKAMVKVDRSEAYLLVGTPGELGSFTQNHASVQLLGLWDGVPVAFKAGDWDYFDFKAKLHPDTPPGSFGGVSGGGLWRVQIYPHPESGEIESTVALEGVAFWEHGTSHGPVRRICFAALSRSASIFRIKAQSLSVLRISRMRSLCRPTPSQNFSDSSRRIVKRSTPSSCWDGLAR